MNSCPFGRLLLNALVHRILVIFFEGWRPKNLLPGMIRESLIGERTVGSPGPPFPIPSLSRLTSTAVGSSSLNAGCSIDPSGPRVKRRF
jgi:hypothetical protein